MATYYDPVADAGDAFDALRGLAHASRRFEHPSDMYGVIGDVLGGVRALQQVLEQLAEAHIAARSRAADDHGDPISGTRDAFAVADELRQAARFVDQTEDHLALASAAAGRIAWHRNPVAPVAAHRWVTIAFFEGEDADEVLDIIDRDGTEAGVKYLQQWDFGDETTGAAMENVDVYDETPHTAIDKEVDEGEYRMMYSPAARHVALYRRHTVAVSDEVDIEILGDRAPDLGQKVSTSSPPSRAVPDSPRTDTAMQPSWFEHPGIAAVKRERGLEL